MRNLLFAALAICFPLLLGGCDTTAQGISGTQLKANLQQLKLGLTSDQVIALIGKPARVNKNLTAAGLSEQWMYTDSQFWTLGQAALVGMAQGANGGGAVHEGQMFITITNGKSLRCRHFRKRPALAPNLFFG